MSERSYFRRPYRITTPAHCTRCDTRMEQVSVDGDNWALYVCPKCEPKTDNGLYKAELSR